MSAVRQVHVARVGDRWSVTMRPPLEAWPNEQFASESEAMVAARLRRFGTGAPIVGHPVRSIGRRHG